MMFSKHWQITLRVFGITVGIVALFAGTGYALDKTFGTGPLGLIAGIILAYPLAQFIIYKTFTKLTK